ncbi:MAG: chromosome segregation protein SMC [Acidimicrobiales bacterium]
MFLKSLTLKGFKSFAETTTLELEPGVTVVVGPNGSGKSNIVDAVAWVLGAQGPRSLRSTKMEDVIFAGSAKRPALGRAEVSLTIDNSAGLLPIEFTEVTLTRTLFRSSGDSEYAINGVPCRLLDVQELLSDSGVGRQQHVIVSQGQLDTVLNARPEERRMLIEEAAGILKFRRRREKAQRRLDATEANLLRLTDLVREVRRQLRPLERQADAARRHGALEAELRTLRLHLAGRELATIRSRAERETRSAGELRAAETALKAELAVLDTAVRAAEDQVSSTDRAGLGEDIGRHEALRERARGLVALLAERRRSAERDRSLVVDADLLAATEAEAARARAELAEVEVTVGGLVPEVEDLARRQDQLDRERAAAEEVPGAPLTPGSTGSVTSAAEVRGELNALRGALARSRSEGDRDQERLDALQARAERMAEECRRLRSEIEAADQVERPLVAQLEVAEGRRSRAEDALSAAEGARRSAEADARAWGARAEALALALDEARARAGAERLAEVSGVVGTLLELVEVDPGWHAAFEAAAGEALAAVVVEDADAARRAIAALREGGTGGAVLALGLAVPGSPAGQAGAGTLGAHVRSARPDVTALLDVLLADTLVVEGDWTDALDAALRSPGVVVVTREGDRFGQSGWRTGAGGAAATGAALEEARARAGAAVEALEEADARVASAHAELAEARAAEAELARSLDVHDARLTALAEGLQRQEADRGAARVEIEGLCADRDAARVQIERDAARVAELEALLPGLEAEEAAGRERVLAQGTARRQLEERASALGALRTDLEVRAARLEQRRALLLQRLEEAEARLGRLRREDDGSGGGTGSLASRRDAAQARLSHTARLAAMVEDRLGVVDAALAELRERRRQQSEAARVATARLDDLRRRRQDAERRLEEIRERSRRAELDQAECRLRLESATEALRRDHDCEPDAAMAVGCPELPDNTTPAARARDLERELRLMGPVNPLALEELEALEQRHAFLGEQLEDVKGSRRELSKVIRAVDAEIVEVFRAAYADVAENFGRLFETLFPGGQGRLRLTAPDDLLETGVEVEARPLGKNVRKLSLLSGGERSLTALAFLFAVFRSRPSPFYLMDEVEAALDDVNLHRFLDLLAEFRQEAQLLVVTHQKRTMEAADCLYGVTMQPGGSSRVLSERVTERPVGAGFSP